MPTRGYRKNVTSRAGAQGHENWRRSAPGRTVFQHADYEIGEFGK
jgi:hypothetical protein